MVPGNRISDIGTAIEAHVAPFGYGIVRDYVGHGIGKKCTKIPRFQITARRSDARPAPIRGCAGMVLAIGR